MFLSPSVYVYMYMHALISTYLGQVFDLLRPNKKISVFRVTDLKILGRVGTHNFFSGKKYNFMRFERHFAFQNA